MTAGGRSPSGAVEFRILGLLEVAEGSHVIDVRGTKLRRLLAALLVRVNQVVPSGSLTEILWDGDPPANAGNGLQAYVSRLRKALGPSAIETRAPGYLLVADPASVDARRFEDLVARGRAARAAPDHETAVTFFEQGLALWRGQALADFAYDEFALPERARLEELRVVAHEELVDAQLAMGRHAQVVGPLRTLVEAHPLRERFWAQLMVALYRGGRQAEALRAFRELRRVVGEELGIEPSPELHRLESDVLLQRPSLDWSPPAVPAATGNDRGAIPDGSRLRGGATLRPPDTRYAKSGGMHIAYQVSGTGDLDIVVVPGWISHLESQWEEHSYRRFMQRLSSSGRVIRFDKRNMGLSDRIGDSMPSLEERMDDVRAVMDAAGSPRAVLVGVSEGSALSILFAATCPDRVSALVLVGGSARLAAGPDYPWGVTEAGAEALGHDLESHWGNGVTLPLIYPSAVGDPSVLEWWARFERIAASPGAAIATATMCLQIDVRQLLPALRMPTLVVHRRDDLLVESGHGRYLAEHIPGARHAELEGNDHWPWTGDADSVLREIEAFLAVALPPPEIDAVLATVLVVEVTDANAVPEALPGGWDWAAADGRGDPLRQALAQFRGREAATDGPRLLATFDGPARAIRCAIAVRDVLRRFGLDARGGLHIGEVRRTGPDVQGPAVDLTGAVLDAAQPGEVVVTRTIRDVVAGAGIRLQDRAPLDPATVPGEWPLFRVAAV